MNRTSTRRHKPKTSDQTLDSQDSRCEDSKGSDESSEDDDEDEDEDEEHSTDRDTEESEVASKESVGNRREWEALAKYLRSQRTYLERNQPDSFHRMSGGRKETKDKMTQKNLTSPMPSIWKPPVYKEISTAPNFRVIKSKEVKEKESDFEDIMLRYITKLQATNNAYRNDFRRSSSHKPTAGERIRKLCSKHKKQAEYRSKRGRREDIHTCMDMGVTNLAGHSRLPERIRNDSGRDLKVHSQCGLPLRYYREYMKKEPKKEDTGKVREKLVYVVEEEGKNVAKMETDLFSVNEILAIKQDLLELSEFAKKLKRLKEMKSESEKGKSSGTECKCRPLTELLGDVNKRMEALEARQEELERGIQKSREMEMNKKKTDDIKMSSISPPLGPVKPEPSAVKSVSSFEKSELSREGGGAFSKNLEIVNELLDIKSQLQRLERKRMSKELSPEIGQAGSTKNKSKDQAINVFSSKTYILTSEAYNKKKINKETPTGEKPPNSTASMKENTAVDPEDEVNDIVTDWLKNISTPEKQNSIMKVYAAPSNLIENESKREGGWRTRSFFKEKHRGRILEGDDFGNQEPQKNRAKDTGRHETNQTSPKYSREIPSHENRKEGRLTSEELFLRNKTRGKIGKDNIAEKFSPELSPLGLKKAFAKPLKIVSSSSVPSVVAVREHIQRRKNLGKSSKENAAVKPSRSKSAQEFTSASYLSKDEKMVLNMTKKNMEAKCARKREKENENEQVQGQLARFLKLQKEMIPIRSRLLASVNLDEGSTSIKNDRSRTPECSLPLFPFPILSPEILKILEYCEQEEKTRNRENWCRRDDWDHKPRKDEKDKDKITACIKKCCRKKTRVKCSMNHCCDKKARRAASRCSRCSPSSSCSRGCNKKGGKKCHQHSKTRCSPKKKKHRKSCSCDSLSSMELDRLKECKKKPCHSNAEKCKPHCPKPDVCKPHCPKPDVCKPHCPKPDVCKPHCPKPEVCKPHCPKPEKCKPHCPKPEVCKPHCPKPEVCKPHCPKPEKCKPYCPKPDPCTSSFETSKTEEESKCQENELPTSETSEPCKEQVKVKHKSSLKNLKHCRPELQKGSFYDDSCYIASFWRNLRKFYPRFSALQLMSWLRLYCQEEKKTKQKCQKKQKEDTAGCKPPREKHKKHDCPDCQCCKSYSMSTFRQKWPGVSRSSEISEDSITEAESRSTNTNMETDFMFPYRKPNLYYAYKATTEDGCEEPKKKKKCKTRKKKKKCQCERCGNIHSRKKKKKKKVCCDDESDSGSQNSKKPKKSILSRLGEVRHLRVCEGKLRYPKLWFSKSKSNCRCICGNKGGDCHCESKLKELEKRIKYLEKCKKKHKKKKKKECSQTEVCCCNEKTKKKKKKKKKKKCEKCDCCCEGKKRKNERETDTYYCECLNKGFKTEEQSVYQTITGTATSTSAPSEKTSFRQNLQKKKKEVLEKLSSLSTFWKNFWTRRKSSDDILLDDSSRSGAVPRKRPVKAIYEEPSVIGKQKKDKGKKEKRVRKCKSRVRRHKFG